MPRTYSTEVNSKRVAFYTKKRDLKFFRLDSKISRTQKKIEALKANSSEEEIVSKLGKLEAKIHRAVDKKKVAQSHFEFNILSKAERIQREHELLAYKGNTLGQSLTFLVLVFELLYLTNALNNMSRTYLTGLTVVINIGILLMLFTLAIKIKVYSNTATKWLVGFGIYNIVRIYVVNSILDLKYTEIGSNLSFIIIGSCLAIFVISIYVALDSFVKIHARTEQITSGKISYKQLSK